MHPLDAQPQDRAPLRRVHVVSSRSMGRLLGNSPAVIGSVRQHLVARFLMTFMTWRQLQADGECGEAFAAEHGLGMLPGRGVARQLELDARDNQDDRKPKWRCHVRLHRLPIILSDQTPVKPGLSGHRLPAASGLTGVRSEEGYSTDGCIANCR